MKKFFVLSVVMLIFFVGLLLAIPMFLDNNSFKQRFIAGLEQVTGRKVLIEGDFSVNILPVPSVEMQGLRMLAADGNDKNDLMDVKRLQAELDLKAFLLGNLVVTKAELIDPVMNFEVSKDGKPNWILDFLKISDVNSGGAFDADLMLESVNVQNATVNFKNVNLGLETSFHSIYGDFVADSLFGPYRFDGSFELWDKKLSLALSLDKLQEQVSSEFNVGMANGDAEATLSVSGVIAYDGVNFNPVANITFDAVKPGILFAKAYPEIVGEHLLDDPIAISLSVEMKDNLIKFTNFVFKQAAVSAVGDAVLRLDSSKIDVETKPFTASLVVNGFDVDKLINAFNTLKTEKYFDIPKNVALDFRADNVVYGGKIIKSLAFKMDAEQNLVKLDDIVAELASDAHMKANLQFKTNEKDLLVTGGNIDVETKNASDIVKWLQIPLLKSDALSTARMTAEVKGEGSVLSLDKMNLRLGNLRVWGSVSSDLALSNRNFVFDINADGVDVAQYISADSAFTTNSVKTTGSLTDLQNGIFKTIASVRALKGTDIVSKVNLTNAILGDRRFNKIVMDIALKDSLLKVNKLELLSVSSGSLVVSGLLSNLETDTPKVTGGTYDAKLVNSAPILEKIGLKSLFDVNKLGNITLSGTLDGDVSNLLFRTSIESSGLDFDADGWFNLAKGKVPSFRANFVLAHSNFHDFAKLLAVAGDVPENNNRAITVKGDIFATDTNAQITGLEISVGTDRWQGSFACNSGKYNIALFTSALTPGLYHDAKVVDKHLFSEGLLEFLQNNSVDFNLKADKVLLAFTTLNSANLFVNFDKGNGKVTLTAINSDGNFALTSAVNINDKKLRFDGDFVGKDWKFTELLPSYAVANISANNALITASFKTSGITTKEFKANFVADGKFVLKDGYLKSLGVLKAYEFLQNRDLNQGTTFEDIFKETNAAYSVAGGSFRVIDRKVTINDFDVVYDNEYKAKIGVDYNFENQMLNMRFDANYLANTSLPSCGVTVSGGLDNLVYDFDVKNLLESMENKAKQKQEAIDAMKKQQAEQKAQEAREKLARKNTFIENLNDLKLSVENAYKQALRAEKMVKLAGDMSSIIANTKVMADKMVAGYTKLVEISKNDEITEADINTIKNDAGVLLDMAKKIDANYGQVVMLSSKKMAKGYADNVLKMVAYAKDMEKSYPVNDEVSLAARDILEADYDVKMALRIVNETTAYKDAEEAVSRAKKAYDKAKIATKEITRLVNADKK